MTGLIGYLLALLISGKKPLSTREKIVLPENSNLDLLWHIMVRQSDKEREDQEIQEIKKQYSV